MQYGRLQNFTDGCERFIKYFLPITQVALPVWICTAIGLVIAVRNIRSTSMQTLLLFFFFSFLAVTPALFFRKHYFIVLLPAAGFLSAVTIQAFHDILQQKLKFEYGSLFLFLVGIGWALGSHAVFYFTASENDILRRAYGNDPFPESVSIAEYISARTSSSDYIQVLGSEPQIYFYSKRRSASGYIYMYGLIEPQPYSHQMQLDLINDILIRKPKFIVFCDVYNSWIFWEGCDSTIIKWSKEYIHKNYTQVGVIYYSGTNKVHYFWNQEAKLYHPIKNFIAILQQNDLSK